MNGATVLVYPSGEFNIVVSEYERDGEQFAVLACAAQYGLPFADAGQADGVFAVRENSEPDVVVGRAR